MDQPDDAPTTRTPAPAEPPPARRGWPSRLALGLLAGIGVLVGLLAVVLLFMMLPLGTRVVLDHVPGLRVVQPKGSLLRNFTAQQIEFDVPGSKSLPRVTIEDFAWLGFHFEHVGTASSGWGVALDTLSARRVVIVLPPSVPRTTPAKLPASLALPLGVRIADVRIGSLQLSSLGAEPITDIHARLSAQQRVGKLVQHRVDGLTLHWRQWAAAGHASLAVKPPYALDAALDLQSATALRALPSSAAQPDNSAQAHLTIGGSLAHVVAQADAQARSQHAHAEVELAPFSDWPLQRVNVNAQGFDLALLDAHAPQTLLSGQLTVQPPPSRVDAPRPPAAKAGKQASKAVSTQPAEPMLDVQGAWRNDLVGRWSDGRLPVRSLQLVAQAASRDGRVGTLERLNIEFGAAGENGGRVQASGQWNVRPCVAQAGCKPVQPAWALNAQLDQLRAALLDAHAPPVLVSGPLNLRGDAPLSQRLGVAATLTGHVDAKGSAQAVLVKVQADLAPGDIQVRALQAQAGAAVLNLSGSAQQQGGQWRVQSTGQWWRFDPSLWWPAWFADASAAARASSSELNGQMDVDLTWRPAADGTSASQGAIAGWLSSLGGRASLVLDRSRLQGVPLAVRIDVRTQDRPAATSVDAMLDVADGHFGLKGLLDHMRPAQDRWNADVTVPDLRHLAPVARLWHVTQIQGALDGKLQMAGRWPALHTDGALHAKGWALSWQPPAAAGEAKRLGAVRDMALERLSAEWHWGPAWADAAAPTETQLQFDGLQVGVWRVDRLRAATTGVVRNHHATLSFDAVLPQGLATSLQPLLKRKDPGATLKVAGQLDMQGQGVFDARRAIWTWREQWQRLLLQPDAASVTGNTLGDRPWLRVEPVETTLTHDAARTEFTAAPVQLTVAGADVAVRQLHWASAAAGEPGPGAIDVDADVAPVQVARVLAALQPDFGWSGDLAVGGSLHLHRGAGARAPLNLDAEVARRSGDLALADAAAEGGAVQRLRLDALHLGLSAHAGVWRFDQQFTGRRFGSLSGLQTVTTDPAALWPVPSAPLGGQLDIDVANLRLWGLWVPAGWRLSGQLQGRSTFKGTVGQPLASGYLTGHQLGLRNLIQGVDFDQGELDLAIDGAQAKLNRLTLRVGPGDLSLTGEARFDAHPEAHLSLALQHFAVLQRVDRRAVVSGRADLSLLADSLNAQGAFSVDEGLFDISKSGEPTLDGDVRRAGVDDVVTDPADERAAARKAPRKVNLDIALDLGSKLRLRGYGLDTGLAGELKLTSGPPLYKPALHGSVKTLNGTFAAYGQKLVIDRGSINFTGAIDNPGLDIEATRPQSRMASSASLTATTTDSDVRVGVTVTGTAQNPRIRLFSDPEMSDTDKLSWLILGHASNGLGGADLAMLQGAASALMGGDSSGANESLFQAIGLDEMTVRQSDTGTRDTVLTVGKQLSSRLYLGYERGLNATTGTWQLIYRLAQRYTLRAQTGLDNSLDFIWVWRWD